MALAWRDSSSSPTLHTQTSHANELAARDAHLLIPVKGNQKNLFSQLKTLPWVEVPVGDRRRGQGHGRKETRTVKALTVALPGGIHFPTPNRPSESPEPAR